jgi:hypothetical protein
MEPEMMDEDSSVARIDELGNQVHNLSCFQDDEELTYELGKIAKMLWDIAKAQTKRSKLNEEEND